MSNKPTIPIEVEVVEELVTCPKCGANNRIRSHSAKLRPICGKCRHPLAERFTVGKSLSSFFSYMRAHKEARLACIAAAILVAVILGVTRLASQGGSRGTSSIPSIQTAPQAIREPQRTSSYIDNQTPTITPAPTIIVPTSVPQPVENKDVTPSRKLPSGTIISAETLSGNGELQVKNGTGLDAVVTIISVRRDRGVASFYVEAGQNGTLASIPDDDYTVQYAFGKDWDSIDQRFTKTRSFGRYDKTLNFDTRTTDLGDRIRTSYSTFSLTLHKTPFGNVTTSGISESEFKKRLSETGAIR